MKECGSGNYSNECCGLGCGDCGDCGDCGVVRAFAGKVRSTIRLWAGFLAIWSHEQSRNTLFYSCHNTSPPYINQPENCSTSTNMAPNLAKSQHTQIRDMIISKFANATIARTVRCSTRFMQKIRLNLRCFGTTKAPPNGIGRCRTITPPMLSALLERLVEISSYTKMRWRTSFTTSSSFK